MRRAISALTTLVVLAIIASSCTATAGVQSDTSAAATIAEAEPTATVDVPIQPVTERESIRVPLTLHVVTEQGDPDSELSSRRTVEEVTKIAENMADIWSQADVVFDPVHVNMLEIPRPVLIGISVGDTAPFFEQVNATFVPQNGQAINGFYVPFAFGVNGFAPTASSIFFVVDEPSVNDERVSSHEVGHIFGLHHDLDDDTQLMFSGTNGTGLSEIEQTVARYSVQRLFPQGIDP